MFVGQGFTVRTGLERAYTTLEQVLEANPQVIALLEFTSRGRKHRQIDCALVGPGGIDLLEIKNKHGVVTGTVDGRWEVTSRGSREGFFNTKNGVEENPFTQARNSADDLRDWLRDALGLKVRVSPLVWLPSAGATSSIERDDFVWHAVGLQSLAAKLREVKGRISPWDRYDYRDLPQLYGLMAMDLASVSGRVVDADSLTGLPGIEVIVNAGETSERATTDTHGHFDFMVTKGRAFEVAFAVPGRYVQPPIIASSAELDYTTLEKVVLAERPPVRSEEELLAQARLEVGQELQAHLAEQAQQAERQRLDERTMTGLVIARLLAELRETRLQLRERQRRLAEQADEVGALPLPVQVVHAAQTMMVRRQEQEVADALERLATPGADAGHAVTQGIDVLADVRRGRQALTWSSPPVLTVRHVPTVPREPLPVTMTEPEDVQDVPFRELPAQPGSGPPPAAPAVGSTAPQEPRPSGRPVWPWIAATLALASLLVVGALQVVQRPTPVPAQATPAASGPQDGAALPGIAAEENPLPNGLPGVPADTR